MGGMGGGKRPQRCQHEKRTTIIGVDDDGKKALTIIRTVAKARDRAREDLHKGKEVLGLQCQMQRA